MAQTTRMKCPDCGATTVPAMGRFYCERCGWNRDAAERRYVRVQWVLPLLILIFDFMGIVALGIERHDWPGAILFATLPTLLLGFVYAAVRQGLARMRTPLRATAESASDEAAVLTQAADAATDAEKSELYAFLLSLPAPRPVRLNRRGRRVVNLLLLFVFGLEVFLAWTLHGVWYRDQVTAQSRVPEIFLVAFMILIACLPFFMRRGMVRDLKLMENGALAMGRVTEQRELRNASAIQYEFEDATGKMVSASANDLTRSFIAGMSIPVFYDAQNPRRNLAVCASLFEIANAGERSR
jgi:hypothetical protein